MFPDFPFIAIWEPADVVAEMCEMSGAFYVFLGYAISHQPNVFCNSTSNQMRRLRNESDLAGPFISRHVYDRLTVRKYEAGGGIPQTK